MDDSAKDGGPAFPRPQAETSQGGCWHQDGMSLRDYFAAKALAGILACPGGGGTFDDIAEYSYKYADAMLKARESQQ